MPASLPFQLPHCEALSFACDTSDGGRLNCIRPKGNCAGFHVDRSSLRSEDLCRVPKLGANIKHVSHRTPLATAILNSIAAVG